MRFYTAQAGHVVNILPPVDITNGKTAQAFSLEKWEHASILLQIGVSAAAPTAVIVNACSDASGDNPVAIAFDYFKQETAGASNDVLSTRQTAPTTGFAPSSNDGIFYVIEIEAAQLPAAKPYVQLQITNTTNSVIASAAAILSGGRYASEASATACT